MNDLKRHIIDVQVEVRFQRRAYKGRRRWVTKRFRVVGQYNAQTKGYHLYITNITPEKLTAIQIVQTYRARWIIELIFKQLKSYYHLEDLPSSKKPIVEALLYTAILTMMASRTVQEVLAEQTQLDQGEDEAEVVFPLLRLAAVLSNWAERVLNAVLAQAGIPAVDYDLTEMLRREAADPNRARKLLLQQIQDLQIA